MKNDRETDHARLRTLQRQRALDWEGLLRGSKTVDFAPGPIGVARPPGTAAVDPKVPCSGRELRFVDPEADVVLGNRLNRGPPPTQGVGRSFSPDDVILSHGGYYYVDRDAFDRKPLRAVLRFEPIFAIITARE